MNLIDRKERELALDTKKSFLVQAPAGSGKTYLLINRFLKALLTIEYSPDEVIAITFTNKAADEMRTRISTLLEKAQEDISSGDEQLLLARKVYELDKDKKLGICSNPNSLSIFTIDALCQKIIKTHSNTSNAVTTLPFDIYEQAVVEMLSDYTGKSWQDDTIKVLSYLNNNYSRLQELLVELLAARDIWLPYITNDSITSTLQNNLAKRVAGIIQYANNTLDIDSIPMLKRFYSIYQSYLGKQGATCDFNDINDWQQIANLVLTKQNTFRKTATSSIGIKAPSSATNKEEKEELAAIKKDANEFLATISQNENLLQALILIRNAPDIEYQANDKEIINALMSLLPVVVAYLNIIFSEQKKADFIAKHLECSEILGHEENPTDFCLNFSNKIKHLLVDEFQDTSLSQLNLIKKLIVAWDDQDQKTLFFVGDPMQSIYKFRQADVAIFTSLINSSLQGIKLNFIQLKSNFRSDPAIINWTNYISESLLRSNNMPYSGSVPFNSAFPVKDTNQGSINCFLLDHELVGRQNDFILQRTQELIKDGVSDIAILVRSRSHIQNLVALFTQEGITASAAEIESLATSSVFIDIANLSLALNNKHDSLSWAALLRSNFCGLSLESIHIICNYDKNRTIYDVINSHDLVLNESCEAKLACFNNIITNIYTFFGSNPPAIDLERAWLALGGLNFVTNSILDHTVNNFFSSLLELDTLPQSWFKWQQLLEKSYIASDNNAAIKIMTIHKSKGLEFQHVIIPSFSEASATNRAKLLNWHQGSITENDLVLGAIPKHKDDVLPVINYLKYIDGIQTENESNRLLYVAATRAKYSLDIISTNELDPEENPILKNNNSFLVKTWHLIKESNLNNIIRVKNLPMSMNIKTIRTKVNNLKQAKYNNMEIKYDYIPDYSLDTLKQIQGKVIHSCIEQMSNQTIDLHEISNKVKLELFEYGIDNIQEQSDYIISVIEKCKQDDDFNWIMCPSHKYAKNEYVIATLIDHKLVKKIIDRTFVCKNNIRWIIDYKLASPKKESLDEFYKIQEDKYKLQLESYTKLFSHEKRTIKAALYFPLCLSMRVVINLRFKGH